jgi:PII-like signaling protein
VRQEGLAGATVLRGIEGIRRRLAPAHVPHPAALRGPARRDRDRRHAEQIDRVVPILDEMVGEGMLTLERVQIVSYRSSDE